MTTEFSCIEIWVMGWLKLLFKVKKLASLPSVRLPPTPLIASAPPMTAQST